MSDLIDRQEAIDAVTRTMVSIPTADGKDLMHDENRIRAEDILVIKRLPSTEPEIIRCKDCKHFEYDHLYIIQGIPVLGHEVCNAWGDGCKTDETGYCFMAERRTDE